MKLFYYKTRAFLIWTYDESKIITSVIKLNHIMLSWDAPFFLIIISITIFIFSKQQLQILFSSISFLVSIIYYFYFLTLSVAITTYEIHIMLSNINIWIAYCYWIIFSYFWNVNLPFWMNNNDNIICMWQWPALFHGGASDLEIQKTSIFLQNKKH